MPASDHESSVTASPPLGCYLLRVGPHGHIGRFRADLERNFRRGERVLCRTTRGLELGVVLAPVRELEGLSIDGKLLRPMSEGDELLWRHLQRLGEDTCQQCSAWLQEQNLDVVLLDVEPLMDGRTLYFHFLSEIDDRVQQYMDQLVGVYEQQVQQSQFAQMLEQGCGPGCGTASAKNGCGSGGGCAVCQVAGGCKPKGLVR